MAATLRRLLKRKSVIEYDDRSTTAAQAREALVRAERLVAWAKESIEGSAR